MRDTLFWVVNSATKSTWICMRWRSIKSVVVGDTSLKEVIPPILDTFNKLERGHRYEDLRHIIVTSPSHLEYLRATTTRKNRKWNINASSRSRKPSQEWGYSHPQNWSRALETFFFEEHYMYGWDIHLRYVLSKSHVMSPIIWDITSWNNRIHIYIIIYRTRLL